MSQDQMQSSHIQMLRNKVVSRAKSLCGIPFRHQGRDEYGLDCVGLPILIGRELKLMNYDVKSYARRTNGHDFMVYFRESGLVEVPWRKRAIGDVLLMKDNMYPCHTAILVDTDPDTIVHAFASRRKVVKELYTRDWSVKFIGLFSYPDLVMRD